MKKNFLCGLGILILIILIALPPVLRITMPEKEVEKPVENHSIQTLSCDSTRLLTRTSYEDGVIKMITIKKVTKVITEETDESESENQDENNQENQTEDNQEGEEAEIPNEENEAEGEIIEEAPQTELDIIYDRIREDSRVVKDQAEDGEIIKIDFTVSDYYGLQMENLILPINDQFQYYESNGLVCTIIQ